MLDTASSGWSSGHNILAQGVLQECSKKVRLWLYQHNQSLPFLLHLCHLYAMYKKRLEFQLPGHDHHLLTPLRAPLTWPSVMSQSSLQPISWCLLYKYWTSPRHSRDKQACKLYSAGSGKCWTKLFMTWKASKLIFCLFRGGVLDYLSNLVYILYEKNSWFDFAIIYCMKPVTGLCKTMICRIAHCLDSVNCVAFNLPWLINMALG